MSKYVKTSSELIHIYAGIIENIVREGTVGSYTYQGVLGCFLNEWLELSPPEKDWDTQEEIYEALTEVLIKNDPAIMQAFNKQREGRPEPTEGDKPAIMTHTEVHAILDKARFGDTLTVVRTNGGSLTSTVSGPVLGDPRARVVGIDMLDGDPYIVRENSGEIWGEFLRVELKKGENAGTD